MIITRYEVKSRTLKSLIKYFWVVKGQMMDLSHKYLPVSNIDLVINLGHETKYITKKGEVTIGNRIYFNGITDSYKLNIQKGTLNMLGVSFRPTGLFPFLKMPLAEFKNRTIEFDLLYKRLNDEIIERVGDLEDIAYSLEVLEEALLGLLDYSKILDESSLRMFKSFRSSMQDMKIADFCSDYGIHKRGLERFFYKYVGTTPKGFTMISRFQNILKKLERGGYGLLTDLAYDSGYYDQMHLIKEFKGFSGSTPTAYIRQKSALRDIIRLKRDESFGCQF